VNVLLCPFSDPGYLYPSIAVGLELRRRGADVHVLGRAGAAPVLAEAGLPFLDAEEYGAGRAFEVGVARWAWETPGQFTAVRQAARDVRADVLVTSVLCHGALLAAEALDLPVAVIGLAAHLWDYAAAGGPEPERPVLRAWRTRDMLRFYDQGRDQVGLPARSREGANPLVGTALLLRGDPALEYPGAVLPAGVHHVGPCAWEPAADAVALDRIREHLDRVGKPVVYVHLGRVFGGTSPWPRLNATFTGGPCQAVVELGRSKESRPDPRADVLVVGKPWMGPLLDRAVLTLSSGTSAPVLNALQRGRPLGLSPDGSEQPLLAAACVRAGVASYVPNDLTRDPVKVLTAILRDAGMRDRAAALARRLAAVDGPGRAADIVYGMARCPAARSA